MLVHDSHPKRLVLLVLVWQLAMASLSFAFDQLFILLVPELVVWFEVVAAITFPREPDSVHDSLSIKPNFVVIVTRSLPANPLP
jgi:hypothetical protein